MVFVQAVKAKRTLSMISVVLPKQLLDDPLTPVVFIMQKACGEMFLDLVSRHFLFSCSYHSETQLHV